MDMSTPPPTVTDALIGFHKLLPGPVRRFSYGIRPAPFRFHGRQVNFQNPYGRRCVEEAAPNSPGVFIKPAARTQPEGSDKGPAWVPAGKRSGTARYLNRIS